VLRLREILPASRGFILGNLVHRRLDDDLLGVVTPELAEDDVPRRGVLRVAFQAGTLEILDGVGITVQVALLLHRLGDRVAVDRQTPVRAPILQEWGTDLMTGLRKEHRVRGRRPDARDRHHQRRQRHDYETS